MLGAFVASRIAAYWAGLRLNSRTDYQWQLLDPVALQTQFWESMRNLHSQPPAFNFLHGAILNLVTSLSGQNASWWILHMLLGVGILMCVYGTLRRVSVEPCLAVLLALIVSCGSPALLYENALTYTYLDRALLCALLYFGTTYFTSGRSAALLGAFGSCVILCFSRPMYHLIWLSLMASWFVYHSEGIGNRLRLSLVASLTALALVSGYYAANKIRFGFFGSSSWAGMNLATMTHTNLSAAQRAFLVSKGARPELIDSLPFEPLERYPIELLRQDVRGSFALDARTRFDGSPNFNHLAYIGVSRRFGEDALFAIRHLPSEYLKSVLRNAVNYLFRTSADYRILSGNRLQLAGWDRLYSILVYGQLGAIFRSPEGKGEVLKHLSLGDAFAKKMAEICLFLPILIIVVPVLAIRKALREESSTAARGLIGCILITLIYGTGVANLMNSGETHRMRFELEPMLFVLLGLVANDTWTKLTGRWFHPVADRHSASL